MVKICKCGSVASTKRIKIERNVADRNVIFHNVPVSVCPSCNEQYLSAKALKQMDRLLTKYKNNTEINFDLDPKEKRLIDILKIMEEQNLVLPKKASDKPISLSDISFIINRLNDLKGSQAGSTDVNHKF